MKPQRTFAVLERKLNAVAAERGELALTIPMALRRGVQAGGNRGVVTGRLA
jgi:hypothetical protein